MSGAGLNSKADVREHSRGGVVLAKKKATAKTYRAAPPGKASGAKKESAPRRRKTTKPATGAQGKTPGSRVQQSPGFDPGETRPPGFPIVGIGASAGGLEAMQEFFDHMPPDSRLAFVVVTHPHRGHTSLLPELLARHSQMPVVEAADGVEVRPNHVYVGPPGVKLAIFRGALQAMESGGTAGAATLPIDFFFRALADDQHERAMISRRTRAVRSAAASDGG